MFLCIHALFASRRRFVQAMFLLVFLGIIFFAWRLTHVRHMPLDALLVEMFLVMFIAAGVFVFWKFGMGVISLALDLVACTVPGTKHVRYKP